MITIGSWFNKANNWNKKKGFKIIFRVLFYLLGRKIRTSDEGTSGEVLTLFGVVGFCWVEFDNVRVREWLSTGRFSSGVIIGEWLLFEDRRAEIIY